MVAIGNAPTALFHLLELIAGGGPHPAAIIGIPVGFVGSAESKIALAENPWEIPYLVVHGRRGGSALCAAGDQRAGPSGGDLVIGRLYAVGVGPGDPDLLTVKAARLIASADVVAYHSGPHGSSIARSIVADLIPVGAQEELLAYPVTTGETDHPGGYAGVIADFYDASTERLAAHLDAGRSVVVLAEGDPLFYSSYGYLHDRLAGRYRCDVVPGVTSLSATSAAVSAALGRHEDVLTVLPGTLPVPELTARLAGTDAVMIMKLGRTFPGVVEALRQADRLAEAVYVERASTAAERVLAVADVDPRTVPYFSMIMVPGRDRQTHRAFPELVEGQHPELLILGLGPGAEHWLTTEVRAALAGVDHVVGYGPYLDRVPGPDRSDQALLGQHRRAGPGPVGARSGPEWRAGRRRLRRRRRSLRDGSRGLRGGGGSAIRRRAHPGPAGRDGGPSRCGPGRCPARWRLRGALAVGPAQAVGGDRGPAPRRGGWLTS